MEKEKNHKKRNIILVVCLCVFVLLLRFGSILALFVVGTFDSSLDYTTDENKIYVTDKNVVIEESSYGFNDDCFIIQLKVDKTKNEKKSLFSYTSYMEIEYQFLDKDGYILGSSIADINDFDDDSNWKIKVNYCDIDANEVTSYKIKSINMY